MVKWKTYQGVSKSFAIYCGTRYCLPAGNGTDALELALRVIVDSQFSQEAEVISVANAGGYTTTACRLMGVTPVYADIISETQLINPVSLINCISERTRCIVLTYLYGGAIDVSGIKKYLSAKVIVIFL